MHQKVRVIFYKKIQYIVRQYFRRTVKQKNKKILKLF